MSVNQIVKTLLSFLMTWTNPLLCATLCFYVLDADETYGANGYEPIYPSLFVFLSAYVIASNVRAALLVTYGCGLCEMRSQPVYMRSQPLCEMRLQPRCPCGCR